MNEDRLYHLGISRKVKAKYAIIPGDPGRVEKIARYLDNALHLVTNREFCTYLGELCGEKVLVTSTGIGGPSASIAVEELVMLGVDTFVRIGTCGGMSEEVLPGDVVIPTGSVRMEGTSREYLPIEYPALSDFELNCDIVKAAQDLGMRYHTGVVQSKDSFYGQHAPSRMPNGAELMRKWEAWLAAGCLASEMETAAVFAVSAARHVRSAAVLHVVWNQTRREKYCERDEAHDTEKAICLTIEGLKNTIIRDRKN